MSTLAKVEFWTITGCSEPRALVPDLFSVSLVLGSSRTPCGLLRTRGAQTTFREGDILLTDAGEPSMTSPTESTHEFFTIYIPREGFERFAREAGLGGSPGWKVSALSSEPLAEAIRQLHALLLSGAGAACVEAAYSAALGALMASAGRSAQSRTSGAAHRGVRRAMKRLSADLSESLSLVDLASEAQMSKCHLVRCFQQALGVPPHRYRMLLRLQCARRLLEQGSSVGEVADRTGFADAPHLTRAFRDWLGASPAAWGNAWRASDPWSTKRLHTVPPPGFF